MTQELLNQQTSQGLQRAIGNILKDFPTSSVNNSRDIVKYLLEKFKKTPNTYWANRLEEVGIAIDFNNLDNGN